MIENKYIKKHVSFFDLHRYRYPTEHTDVFSIPRPTMNLVYIENGYAKLTFGGETVIVKEGSFAFVPQSSIYNAVWCGSQITVRYSFSHFSSFYKEKNLKIQTFTPSNAADIVEIIRFLSNFNGSTEQAAYDFLGKFFFLLGEIYKNIQYSAENDYAQIKGAITYINENFKEKFHIHKLAKICGMSDTQFFSEFKKITGYTPVQYKNIITVHQIQSRLKESDESISNLAEEFNFSSTFYFCKLFKSLTGKTPTEYRNE